MVWALLRSSKIGYIWNTIFTFYHPLNPSRINTFSSIVLNVLTWTILKASKWISTIISFWIKSACKPTGAMHFRFNSFKESINKFLSLNFCFETTGSNLTPEKRINKVIAFTYLLREMQTSTKRFNSIMQKKTFWFINL